jgi:hypothetical protein
MTPIQIILILSLGLAALIYMRTLRPRLVGRVAFFVVVASGVLMVARPDWANAVAHFFGVGRGADLVTYLGLSGLALLWLATYSRQRELEEKLTELSRQMAILEAEKPNAKKK